MSGFIDKKGVIAQIDAAMARSAAWLKKHLPQTGESYNNGDPHAQLDGSAYMVLPVRCNACFLECASLLPPPNPHGLFPLVFSSSPLFARTPPACCVTRTLALQIAPAQQVERWHFVCGRCADSLPQQQRQ